MQRIDENTYIDDTLVTCAEYQLFIDEMREQGKYYQPDHWKTHRFPRRQARKPILGVRHSDAEMFCKWLMLREGGSWKYRLPTAAEAFEYPLNVLAQSSIGYWIEAVDSETQLTWIGATPVDARTLNDERILILLHTKERTLYLHYSREIKKALDLSRTRPLNINFDRPFSRNLVDYRYDALENYSVEGSLYYGILATDGRHNIVIFSASVLIRQVYNYLIPNLNGRALAFAVALVRRFVRLFVHDIADIRDKSLFKYIDIFTLQERIAGRSPAFEGIRLIKERIR